MFESLFSPTHDSNIHQLLFRLWMVYISKALNAHRWFACTPQAVLMVSQWSAVLFSTRMCLISYSWITYRSCTVAEKGNGPDQDWPMKERSTFHVTSKNVQPSHLQVPRSWRLYHNHQGIWDNQLLHYSGHKSTTGIFVSPETFIWH